MTTTATDEAEARRVFRSLHLLHAVKTQQLALYRYVDDKHADDHHLSFLIDQANRVWGDLVSQLAAALGIQPHMFNLSGDCLACLAANEPCDDCAEARYDELVTAVYSAARDALEGWGIAVDAEADKDRRLREELDHGFAHELWAWVAGRMPGVIAKVGAE